MLQAACEKVDKGGAIGPFIATEVPHNRFNSHRRFVVEQPTEDNPNKKRCVDDPKSSGENERTTLHEKMTMRGFEGLVDLLLFLMLSFPEVGLHMFAEDYENAFEQLALHPSSYAHMYFQLLVDGMVRYFMHTSGWFGLKAMPAQFCRLSNFIRAVLALKFAIMSVVHMDKVIGIEPHLSSPSAIVCFRRVVASLGFVLKASKERLPAYLQQGLGGLFSLPRDGQSSAEVSLPADKVRKYSSRLQGILESSSCPPALAPKVGGYIQTINSRLWGHAARAFSWPIYHQANHGVEDAISPRRAYSIETIIKLLVAARPRILRPLQQRRLCIIYFDSCGHPETLAGLLLAPEGDNRYFTTPVFSQAAKFLDPDLTNHRNTQLEALAPLLAVTTFQDQLRECDVLAYGDNIAALQALRKGYSPRLHMCSIVAAFWILAMQLDANICLEYVASEANPADPLSRPHQWPGLSYASAHSWRRVEVACPNAPTFGTLRS